MKVTEIMNTNPRTCTYSDTAQQAATLMKQHGTGFLPVVNEHGKVVGVVTDRDLCLRVTAEGHFPLHMRVHECMTANPVCCFATESIRNALALMANNQIRRIPVINDERRPIGIVAMRDFIARDAISARDIYLVLRKIMSSKERVAALRARIA